jgi:hypothetical protein
MSGTEQAVADPPVLWGAVSAAHQVEDGNVASDNWASEHDPSSSQREPSGDVYDSYHRNGVCLDSTTAKSPAPRPPARSQPGSAHACAN